MKRAIITVLLVLLITSTYAQRYGCGYSRINHRMSKSVKYHQKLQKGLMSKPFKFKNKKHRVVNRRKRYSFRVR
jgi:hypothetical protein